MKKRAWFFVVVAALLLSCETGYNGGIGSPKPPTHMYSYILEQDVDGSAIIAISQSAAPQEGYIEGVNMGQLPEGTYSASLYANGKFVAIGENCAAYSTDGINWQAGTLTGGGINGIK